MAGVDVVVACDVDNPLTGPTGAAAVYGPQKGAGADEVRELDDALGHFADAVATATGRDLRDRAGAGAAGGVGFAALACPDAELRPGIDLVLDLVDFHQRLAGRRSSSPARASLDEQTLHGKAPAGVAAAARAAGIPVVAVCGRNTLDRRAACAPPASSPPTPCTDVEPDVDRCLADPAPLLERLGERIAADHFQAATSRRSTTWQTRREWHLTKEARWTPLTW